MSNKQSASVVTEMSDKDNKIETIDKPYTLEQLEQIFKTHSLKNI